MMAISSTKLSIDGIKMALKCGKNLSVLSTETKNKIAMDLDDFRAVLNLAKFNRVKVTISSLYSCYEYDIPTDVLDANRKWFDVKYGIYLPTFKQYFY